eukprot:14881253-Alexandrium_andersonii.AAC.1
MQSFTQGSHSHERVRVGAFSQLKKHSRTAGAHTPTRMPRAQAEMRTRANALAPECFECT